MVRSAEVLSAGGPRRRLPQWLHVARASCCLPESSDGHRGKESGLGEVDLAVPAAHLSSVGLASS